MIETNGIKNRIVQEFAANMIQVNHYSALNAQHDKMATYSDEQQMSPDERVYKDYIGHMVYIGTANLAVMTSLALKYALNDNILKTFIEPYSSLDFSIYKIDYDIVSIESPPVDMSILDNFKVAGTRITKTFTVEYKNGEKEVIVMKDRELTDFTKLLEKLIA